MTVLVVDDSRTIRQLLTIGLRDLGADEIIEAESADKALRLLKFCSSIDVIVTDWHMPGMNGLEFLKTLRADERFKFIPIVMSTSESAGENVVAALRAGATNYLIKPFNNAQLADRVGPYLRPPRDAAASSAVRPGVSQTGVLKQDDLADVLQFFVQSRKTGRCDLSSDVCRATLYFEDGKLCAARAGELIAEEAFFFCFQTRFQRYSFHEEKVEVSNACRISISTPALLLEALAREDERDRKDLK